MEIKTLNDEEMDKAYMKSVGKTIWDGVKEVAEAAKKDTIRQIKDIIANYPNPYLLKDTDGGLYNKYPEFEMFENFRQELLKLI